MSRGGLAQSLAALVPMRHHSERVPGKNYRIVAGRALYEYILESLLACPEIDRVVVDTDSPVIRDGIAAAFPAVTLLERPAHLRPGDIPMNVIIEHDIQAVPADLYLQTHSTNPLLRPETISRAIQAFRADGDHDSLFSVTPVQVRLWSPDGRAINHDPEVLLRTQDLPPVYEENSCLYLFRRDVFLERRNRIGRKPKLFVIDRQEAWDVDEESDLAIVEAMLKKRDEA
ncbi:MAG TPA: acylneuraminate cytidylyltransferase family protein [Anaerolineales bacterium]|nr:acylneuraminate cytidylyltransferase family protein [Anaerolineales bacterium]